MRRIAVMTSGGDAPGMNAALRAVVRTATANDLEVFGIRQAYKGLLAGDFERLTNREVSGILQRGGTILQTARNLEFREPAGQKRGLRRLNEQGIEGLVVIGGDGSLRGAMALAKMGMPVVGIPGSIDNDIYGTDMCIGVDTALNTILDAIDRVRDTATSHERAFLIEAMGRNCGYLTMMSAILGGAEVVHIPEKPLSVEEIGQQLEDAYMRGKNHAVAVVAEGANPKIDEIKRYLDRASDVGFEVRVVILGHVQRGGSPSAYDRLLATRMGVAAVEFLLEGQTCVMTALQAGHGDKEVQTSKIVPVPLEDVTSNTRTLDVDYWWRIAHMLSR